MTVWQCIAGGLLICEAFSGGFYGADRVPRYYGYTRLVDAFVWTLILYNGGFFK